MGTPSELPSARVAAPAAVAGGTYRHEAFLYAGERQFLRGTLGFIREAMATDEPILVALAPDKLDTIQRELGGEVGSVELVDMVELGANPARIIPAWHDFIARHAAPGHRLRGIGEPIWSGRSPAELVECQHHEALLNVAITDPSFWLLCPYDIVALDPAVVTEALRTHPVVRRQGVSRPSTTFPGSQELATPLTVPLPAPRPAPPGAGEVSVLTFGPGQLSTVRDFIRSHAAGSGLQDERISDLVTATNEITTNSLVHGGGRGTVRIWDEAGSLICEVHDRGHIGDPLIGRSRPSKLGGGGRGLWLANQLCDLVQIRSHGDGCTVRLHMTRTRMA